MNPRMIIDDVRDQYAGVARGELSNDSSSVRSIASAFGYSEVIGIDMTTEMLERARVDHANV